MSSRIKKAFVTAKQGITRLFAKTVEVENPVLVDPYHRPRVRIGSRSNKVGKRRLGVPPCRPGTITYHDQLVRWAGYNRKVADNMQATGDFPKLDK